jgi:hypothetical protein
MWAYPATWPTLSPRLHKADLLEILQLGLKMQKTFFYVEIAVPNRYVVRPEKTL